MNSSAVLNPELGPTVHIASSVEEAMSLNPQNIFRSAEFLVVDNYTWMVDFDLLQSGLTSKVRKFKDPFSDKPVSKEREVEVARLQAEADTLFSILYPDFEVTDRQGSYRPMITKDEPMHFDTRPKDPHTPYVTSFINISAVPRVYNIGPNLSWLCKNYPKLMIEIWKASGTNDVSFELRARTMKNKPPLNSTCPKHRVELAPGAIWFMDAKTVSHEVVYGEGVVARGWTVPYSGAPQQPEILKQLKQLVR